MPDEKSRKEEMEALEIALKTEEDGYKYFREAVTRSADALVKKFFSTLANDEFVHINLIKEYHANLAASALDQQIALPNFPDDYKSRIKTIFEEARKEIKGKVTPDTGVLDVYRNAMDLETKAANFYKERVAITKYPQAKKLYDWLFRFESEHYRMLSETLSYLEKSDLWYMDFEKAIFEG
jgi:rubrerythrin